MVCAGAGAREGLTLTLASDGQVNGARGIWRARFKAFFQPGIKVAKLPTIIRIDDEACRYDILLQIYLAEEILCLRCALDLRHHVIIMAAEQKLHRIEWL